MTSPIWLDSEQALIKYSYNGIPKTLEGVEDIYEAANYLWISGLEARNDA